MYKLQGGRGCREFHQEVPVMQTSLFCYTETGGELARPSALLNQVMVKAQMSWHSLVNGD